MDDRTGVPTEGDLRCGEPQALTDGSEVDLRPQWNCDSKSMVFERHKDGRSLLFMLTFAGARAPACEPLDLCNHGAQRTQGRAAFFSQDVFAFVSDRGGVPAIWHADIARHEIEPLSQPAQDEADFGPTTVPAAHGRFLFFRKIGPHGRPHLFQGEVGSAVQPLSVGRHQADQPWFLLHAKRLVLHSQRDGDDAVFIQPAEHGAAATRLSPPGGEKTSYVTPFPSPDGRHVVFASARTGTCQLWAMRSDGSAPQQITFDATPSCFPAWSPDGKYIVFVRGDPLGLAPSGRLMTISVVTANA